MSKDYHVVVNQDAVYFYGYVWKKEIKSCISNSTCGLGRKHMFIFYFSDKK